MNIALNTTKRKFHKLLDNLTASPPSSKRISLGEHPNTSTTSLAAPTEPPAKRFRTSVDSLERPRTAPGNSSLRRLPRNGDESRSSVRLVGTQGKERPSTPWKTPNYAPWSREQFLARLKTFSDVKLWTSKPDTIGEVEWAMRGWTCEGWNKVACKGGCEQRIAVRLRPKRKDEQGREIEDSEDVTVEIDEPLIERYRDLIVSGHSEFCLWRKAGCKKDIYHIPIARRDRCEQDLRRRFKSLRSIREHLPPPGSISLPEELQSLRELVQLVSPAVFTGIGELSSGADSNGHEFGSDEVAVVFALFGWSGLTLAGLPLATCDECFQRIGLWMYTKSRMAEMSQMVDCEESLLRLNLLEMHREHCPWKNPLMQANPPNGPYANMGAFDTLRKSFQRLRKAVNGGASAYAHASEKSDRLSAEVEESERDRDERTDERVKGLRNFMNKLKSIKKSRPKTPASVMRNAGMDGQTKSQAADGNRAQPSYEVGNTAGKPGSETVA